jgi:hypothetical protein
MKYPVPTAEDRQAAVMVAVAICTAMADQTPGLTVEQLVGDADPLLVVSVLSVALGAVLEVTLGGDGRSSVLNKMGLRAARGEA